MLRRTLYLYSLLLLQNRGSIVPNPMIELWMDFPPNDNRIIGGKPLFPPNRRNYPPMQHYELQIGIVWFAKR